MDYFLARYYSSAQGRFTSVDPENAGASHGNPQSWNGYAYSLNNALRFIDPDGLRWAQYQEDGVTDYKWLDDTTKDDNGRTEYDRGITAGYSAVNFDESKSYSFTNGLIAPGETLTNVTLNLDGSTDTKSFTLTMRDWLIYVAIQETVGDKLRPPLELLASKFGDLSDFPTPNLPVFQDQQHVPPLETLTRQLKSSLLVRVN